MLVVLGVLHRHDDVLQDVRGGPVTAVLARVFGVRERHHLVDRARVRRGALRRGGRRGRIDLLHFGRVQRLHIPCLARGRERERVFTDRHWREELLGRRAAHRAAHGEHWHILQVEALEDALIRAALVHVRLAHALFVHGERIGILHDELAAADEPRARTELVAVLRLDLVQRDGQVLVRRVHVFHEQCEHLLVRGGEQIVGLVAVLQTEDVVAVLLPTVGRLIRLARQQRGEMHLLRADAVDLLADDLLDLVEHGQAERQPCPDAGRGLADIAGALEQFCGIDVCVCGVFAQRTQEQRGHSKCSSHTVKLCVFPDICGRFTYRRRCGFPHPPRASRRSPCAAGR